MKKILLMLMLTAAITAGAADWPQFCGPDRNNLSSETALAREWPADGPDVLWTVNVTTGYAGPAVLDDRVYLMGHEENESSLRCYDFESGKELWSVTFDDPGTLKNKKYPGTRGTPTVTKDAVYAVTLYGTVFCVDLDSKEIKWSIHMKEDFGKKSETFGFAQSPLLVDDLVIIAPLSKSHGVLALNKETGKAVWNSTDFTGGGYVSPSLIQVAGKDQILVVAGGERPSRQSRRKNNQEEATPKEPRPTVVFAVSPQDGSLLWSYDKWSCRSPIPHPVVTGENTIFISSGYKSISTMLEINGGESKELWKTEDAATWIEQPIFVNDHLFVGGTVKKNKDGLICMDLDANVVWDSNKIAGAPKFQHLNMIAADDMLIGLDGNSGKLHLIEASPEGFNELASAGVVAKKGQTWAPIALSDGKLLVRDHNEMKCLNLK